MEELAERQNDFDADGKHDGGVVCPHHSDDDLDRSSSCFDLPSIPKADITIFTGDLNAEPNDRAIRLISDTKTSGFEDFYESVERLPTKNMGSEEKVGGKKRKEPLRPAAADGGLTFNANDHGPLGKRIDYIFVKNRRGGNDDGVSSVGKGNSLRIIPESLEHLGHRDRRTKGLEHPASDHVALLARMKFVEDVG